MTRDGLRNVCSLFLRLLLLLLPLLLLLLLLLLLRFCDCTRYGMHVDSQAARLTLGGDKAASATYFAVYGFGFLGSAMSCIGMPGLPDLLHGVPLQAKPHTFWSWGSACRLGSHSIV